MTSATVKDFLVDCIKTDLDFFDIQYSVTFSVFFKFLLYIYL